MEGLTAHPDGVLALDSGFGRAGLAAVHIVIHQGEAAIIDTGTHVSVPRVLSALGAAGVAPARVRWVVLTHVHLDHAGGAGSLMCALPSAQLVVHPRGARHMIDPSQLWQATVEVYGAAQVLRQYRRLVPVAAERVLSADDGHILKLGDRRLTVLHTPGHARHHLCLHDPVARVCFTGDTFGFSYRELDVEGRVSVLPSTTPSQFDPEALHASINRLVALQPQAMYLTHYSRVTEVPRLAADLHRLIDAQLAVASAARGEGAARHAEIVMGLQQLIRDESERQGWTLAEQQIFELLEMDLELNAQGLAVWLDTQRSKVAVPA